VAGHSIEYHFEEASSLHELKELTARQVQHGWIPSGEARQFEVKLTPDLIATRYSQVFSRPTAAAEPSLTHPPFHFLKRIA
jgi:hypothetical protein